MADDAFLTSFATLRLLDDLVFVARQKVNAPRVFDFACFSCNFLDIHRPWWPL